MQVLKLLVWLKTHRTSLSANVHISQLNNVVHVSPKRFSVAL